MHNSLGKILGDLDGPPVLQCARDQLCEAMPLVEVGRTFRCPLSERVSRGTMLGAEDDLPCQYPGPAWWTRRGGYNPVEGPAEEDHGTGL